MATFVLSHDTARKRAMQACREVPEGWVVIFREPKRSLEQNAILWVYLSALSKQLEWPVLVNGQWNLETMSPDDWKDMLSGSFEGECRRMARCVSDTGLIVLGAKTSSYGKQKFSEFIEFVKAFCAQHNIEV